MRSESQGPERASAARPEVIVDFSVEHGLLTVHLKNVGERPAFLVKTVFDKPFTGLNGEKPISELRIFRKLEFMAPGKEFAQFIDQLAAYAKRKQPLRIEATLSYRDREGTKYDERIVHDLRSYLELGRGELTSARRGD